VVVTATVTAKIGEKIMFLIEVKQAGIFQIRNVPTDELEPILAVMCPNILFPYLREVVSDVAVRGGFAPVLLNPINFDALYQQQKQQQAQAASSTTTH
jgi:preprotein translocase subunit SecB